MILLVAVVTLHPMAIYSKAIQSTAVLVALFVCLAPTTIGGLLSAIGIAGRGGDAARVPASGVVVTVRSGDGRPGSRPRGGRE